MKRFIYALFILALAMLACSLSPQMPTAGHAAEFFPTEQVFPSPIPTITTEPTEPPITCTVTAAEALHLRNAPTIEGDVIAWLAHGDLLTLSPDPPAGVWVKVTDENISGFVNSKFITCNEVMTWRKLSQ